jgi:hypothetical protein
MLILAVCIICQVTEMFDQWDHTLQTGNDTEYTFVVLALCAGVAYSLKWFMTGITLPASPSKTISYSRYNLCFSTFTNCFSSFVIPLSPPAAALRV